jgi:hypothetical protein
MWQDGFRPEDIQHKTMRTMDKNIRDAMMSDYELYEVDLTEGNNCLIGPA